MDECLDFWTHNLKGIKTPKQENAKKMTWFQCEGIVPPTPVLREWPGCWMNSDSATGDKTLELFLNDNNLLTKSTPLETDLQHSIFYDPYNGLTCGEMLSSGDPDLPGEQRFFNHPHMTWTMNEKLTESMDIYGFPEFSCQFEMVNDTEGQLTAKLCDLFPDGSSRLLTVGNLNLCHHKSHENPESLVIGKKYVKL